MLKVIANVMVFLFLSLIVVTGYSVAAEKSEVTYEKNIEQIISGKCLSCHGSDSPINPNPAISKAGLSDFEIFW